MKVCDLCGCEIQSGQYYDIVEKAIEYFDEIHSRYRREHVTCFQHRQIGGECDVFTHIVSTRSGRNVNPERRGTRGRPAGSRRGS